jgi:hypothetical protein
MDKDDIEKLKIPIYLIVLVVILGAFFNIPSALTNWVIQYLIGAFVGSVFSLVAGALVEAFTGDLLKKITLTFKVFGFQFSFTVFAIATFIVKVWLFGW